MRRTIFTLVAIGAPLILFLTTDPTIKAAAIIIYLAAEGILAFALKPLRRLLFVDLVVMGFVGALLIASPMDTAYSPYVWAWLGHGFIVLALALIEFGIVRLPFRTVYWALIAFSGTALVGALLLLPPHYSLLALLLILWTLGGLPLIGAALLGRDVVPPSIPLSRALLIAAVAAGCVVSLRSIRVFPNWSATDEAIIFDYVDSFRQTRQIGATLIPYDAPIVTGNLYVDAAALWTGLFPGDPFALRDLSALGGIALIGIVFLTARTLRDPLTGWIAAALLATNLLWTAVAHVGRQEMWLAVFVWAAVWLSLAARERQSAWVALLAGVTVALSADVHPLGALACLALGVWWLVWPRRASPLRKPGASERRLLFAFVLGGMIGAGYYVSAHVLPDPAYFLAGLRDELVSYGAEGWTPLAAMLARHLNYLESNPLEVALLIICSFWALAQRPARGLAVFVSALMALYAFTVADPNLYYPIVWITGLVILTALALRSAAFRWRAPLAVAFLAAFVLNAALIERHLDADWNGRAFDATQQVTARLPPDGRGTGETFLYLALRETRVPRDPRLIGFTFVNFWAARAGITGWQMVETLNPAWIVRMRDESAFTPEFGVLSVDVPHMGLEIPDSALAQGYSLADSIPTSVGTFEIWRRS